MSLRKIVFAFLLLVFTAVTAGAYTIVMRDGRRVVIPNEFVVTSSTLTYQAGSDIQITIQLNAVDIAATERANGEANGALLLRASAPKKVAPAKAQVRPRAQRSITNQDLEVYRRARERKEEEYEKRRQELGLPSLEERQLEAAEVQERTREQLLTMRAQEEREEEYWRSRATPLRTELAATQAQIEFLRRRIDELSLRNTNAFGVFVTGAPFGGIPFGTVRPPFINFPFQSGITPNVFAPSLVNPSFRAQLGVNAGNRPGRFVSPGARRPQFPGNGGRFHRGGRGRGVPSFAGGSVLAVPFQFGEFDVQRSELISELDNSLRHQAGLQARWRDLENEARRAGAYPGWLRP
jgi:hypothetical protein